MVGRRWLFPLAVGVVAGLITLACTPVEDTEDFYIARELFDMGKGKRYNYYKGFHWHKDPPWTAADATEQLAYRISVDSPDIPESQLFLWNFTVFSTIQMGTSTQLGEGSSMWEVVVPPIDELRVAESVWRVYDGGGYVYQNKAAAQIAACLAVDLFRNSDDVLRIYNVVDCPAK